MMKKYMLLTALLLTAKSSYSNADSDAKAKVPGSWKDSCHDASYNENSHVLTATCKTKDHKDNTTSITVIPGKNYYNIDGHLSDHDVLHRR